jgi:DNA-binding MarR family transcriptional regulator
MSRSTHNVSQWTFLTNHAHVLLCIAKNPDYRLRDIADAVGITERASHRIVSELVDAGFVDAKREGRCNVYAVHPEKHLRHPMEAHRQVLDLIRLIEES